MSVIVRAEEKDVTLLTRLAMKLWPGHDGSALACELEQLLVQADCALFLVVLDGRAVGFAQCQLRRDYVEGTSGGPVGYLEGIYLEPEFRGCGWSQQLLFACEKWAREQGCREFASDCELENEVSLRFHLKLGFSEVNRIICFAKKI